MAADSDPRREALEFRRWRLLHKAVHGDREPAAGRTVAACRTRVGDPEEPEIDAWIDQQVETATHRATDNPDLGPRKDGPCHDLLLEYVANRKRMAQAVSRRVQEDVGSDPAPDRDETGGVVDRHRQPDD